MERPKLPLKMHMFSKIFNTIALILFFVTILYIMTQWSQLPNQVPTHYNAFGKPDDWGHKGFIFLPLIISILMWIGLHFLEKKPHLHNYVNIKKENIEQHYKNSSLMINALKNELLIIFSFMAWNDVSVSMRNESLLGAWELPLVFAIILGTLAIFIIRSIRINKSTQK
jgi:uncharacterized membrane protein